MNGSRSFVTAPLLDQAKGLVFLLIFLFFWSFVPGRAVAGKIPRNHIMVIDDFNDKTMPNNLFGMTQGDEEFPGGCIPTFVTGEDAMGLSGASLALTYDVRIPDSFSFYSSKLGPPTGQPGASETLDISEFQYLSFWFRSKEERPRFGLEVYQDTDGDQLVLLAKDIRAKVPIAEYVQPGEGGAWRKAVLPLKRFRKVRDWSEILQLVFVFEQKFDIEDPSAGDADHETDLL